MGDKNFIRTGVKLNNKFFNPKLVTELAANKLLCDGEIFDVYQDLQHRKLHPLGVFDNANRFFVNEDYSDLIDVRSPSRAWPNSENKACRSFEFCKKVVVKFKCKTKSDLLAHFTKKS